MTQIIKTSGMIKNPLGRPIYTSANISPFFLLDMRRHAGEYSDGEAILGIQALGSIPESALMMSPLGANCGLFRHGPLPHLEFNGSNGLTTSGLSFPPRDLPLTTVCVYRVSAESWPLPSPNNRIYSMGKTADARCMFGPISNELMVWTGSEAGTSFKYDEPHSLWAVGVHQFNGADSLVIDRNGRVLNANLKPSIGIGSISIWGTVSSVSGASGGVAYMAAYSGVIDTRELLQLFYDAKNDFNIP